MDSNSTVSPKQPQNSTNSGNYLNPSLYVGDLSEKTTETDLFDIFSKIGILSNVNIVRDKSARSLGSAYVYYHSVADAQNALNELNFTPINGKEMRIMWNQPDASLRNSGIGNIFIKNLDESIDNRTLHNHFSVFGDILSSKLMQDCNGKSLGYGFVHYRHPEDSKKAIENLNGKELGSKTLYVAKYQTNLRKSPKQITNLYVKQFTQADFPTEKEFKAFFEHYGKVKSVHFPLHENGTTVGFAFVDFESPEVAKKVIENFADSPNLYVAAALSKTERQRQVRKHWYSVRDQIDAAVTGRNVFVKNLSDSINTETLTNLFANCGEVEKAAVALNEDKTSRNFGFVLFKTPQMADYAISTLNNLEIDGKRLFVTLWQRKELLEMQRQQQKLDKLRGGFNPGYSGAQAYPSQMQYNNPITIASVQNMQYQLMQQQQQQQINQYFSQPQIYEPRIRKNIIESEQIINYDKEAVGKFIYEKAIMVNDKLAKKLTGMLLQMKPEQLKILVEDEKVLLEHLSAAELALTENTN